MSKHPLLTPRVFVLMCLIIPSVSLAGNDTLSNMALTAVKIHRLTINPENQQPVVLLSDASEMRAMPIWIDHFQAHALYLGMEKRESFRPLTHDLLEKIIKHIQGKLHRIIITHASENVFYAVIEMDIGGARFEMDARPSDAIILAVKFDTPLFVSTSLFEKMAVTLKASQNLEDTYGLTLQELTPDLAEYFSFPSEKGVLVTGVRKESPADKDGVQAGDIFIEFKGEPTMDILSFRKSLSESKGAVKAKIFRKGIFQTIDVHLRPHPDAG